MTLTLALLLALSGGLGAASRYAIDVAVSRRFNTGGPLGILVVNVSASFLAGLVVGLATGASEPLLSEAARFTLVAGFLGGYSTLSTVSVDTVQLARDRKIGWMLVNTIGMLLLSIGAVLVGILLTRGLT